MNNDTIKLIPKSTKQPVQLSCGNCWGHQEYMDNYVYKQVELDRIKNDTFISRFVNKYIRK